MRAAALALVALAACVSAPVRSEQRPPPLPPEVIDTALAPAITNDGGTRAQYLSMLGREDLVERTTQQTCVPLTRDGARVDPIEEIARFAQGSRVVIVNEDHGEPRHRVFIEAIAVRLRQDGFDIYAAETFLPHVREHRTWPHVDDGFYSSEPAFGALLRRLRELNYRLEVYEDFSPLDMNADPAARIAQRETTQAANLQRILAENPDARLLVHVGFSHLLEVPDRQGRIWMAQRLKEATGIDPLTIAQTGYSSGSTQFTFCDPTQTPSVSVDYRIGSPEPSFENGRPAWRQHVGQRPVAVPESLLRPMLNTIIEARIEDEPNEAVPVDRLLLRPGDTLPLLLPPGRYRLESWSQESGWSAPVAIRVD